MTTLDGNDPRDIPILTDEVDKDGRQFARFDGKAVHAAVVSETLKLADSLLNQAAREIEASLFQRVFDELRTQLPELVDRVLREHTVRAATDPPSVTDPLVDATDSHG